VDAVYRGAVAVAGKAGRTARAAMLLSCEGKRPAGRRGESGYMASQEVTSMAVFCDFENIALGVEDARYEKFDIKRVLEKLLLKGSIVVKKAYCDW